MPGPKVDTEKTVKISDLGSLITADELTFKMLQQRAQAHTLATLTNPDGDKFTIAFISGLGLAIFSAQTAKAFVMECGPFMDLAVQAGIEQGKPVILEGEAYHG